MSAIRHADPYALSIRRKALEAELQAIDREEARRAAASPAGLLRETPVWSAEGASTLPREAGSQ